MRVRAKAKTHEHFPSNQEVPFLLTCPSLKMPNHYKEESFRNRFWYARVLFPGISKLTNDLWKEAPLLLKQLSNSIIPKILSNFETILIFSEWQMARWQGQESESKGYQMKSKSESYKWELNQTRIKTTNQWHELEHGSIKEGKEIQVWEDETDLTTTLSELTSWSQNLFPLLPGHKAIRLVQK